MQLRQVPTLAFGLTRTIATLQDPVVTVSDRESDPLTLCIEEAGVVLELEFPDAESLARFQSRVAAARWQQQGARP
jgi:hypothetical protein